MSIAPGGFRRERSVGGATPQFGLSTMAAPTAQPTAPQAPKAYGPISGRNFQAGTSPVGDGMFSNGVTFDMLGTGQWGTGESFMGAGNVAGSKAIRDAQSSANPEDYADLDALRSYYRFQLGNEPQMTADSISLADTRAQLAAKSAAENMRNSAAGRGTLGSRQYSARQADLGSQLGNDYINSLINARAQGLQRGQNAQAGLQNVQDRDTAERAFQMQQAQALSDQIMSMLSADARRQSTVQGLQAAEDSANTNMWATFFRNSGKAASMAGMAAASDARAKRNVRQPTLSEVLSPFNKAKPYSYEYKRPDLHGEGRRISPMAQDLQAAGMGDCVFEEGGVLHVDYGRAMGRMFAAISALTQEVAELKKGVRRG